MMNSSAGCGVPPLAVSNSDLVPQVRFSPCDHRISRLAWGILKEAGVQRCPVCLNPICTEVGQQLVQHFCGGVGCNIVADGSSFVFLDPNNEEILRMTADYNDTVLLTSKQDFVIEVLKGEAQKAGVLPENRHIFYTVGHLCGLVMAKKDSHPLVGWILGEQNLNNGRYKDLLFSFQGGCQDYEGDKEEKPFGGGVRLINRNEGVWSFIHKGKPVALLELAEGAQPLVIKSENDWFISALQYEADWASALPSTAFKGYALSRGKNLSYLTVPGNDASKFEQWLKEVFASRSKR